MKTQIKVPGSNKEAFLQIDFQYNFNYRKGNRFRVTTCSIFATDSEGNFPVLVSAATAIQHQDDPDDKPRARRLALYRAMRCIPTDIINQHQGEAWTKLWRLEWNYEHEKTCNVLIRDARAILWAAYFIGTRDLDVKGPESKLLDLQIEVRSFLECVAEAYIDTEAPEALKAPLEALRKRFDKQMHRKQQDAVAQ